MSSQGLKQGKKHWKHVFIHEKCETWYFQRHFEWHHGKQDVPLHLSITKGVSPSNLWASHKCNELNHLTIGWRRPNLVHNVAKIISKGITQNDGMIRYAKNHALEPRPMHDLKQMRWRWEMMFEWCWKNYVHAIFKICFAKGDWFFHLKITKKKKMQAWTIGGKKFKPSWMCLDWKHLWTTWFHNF
jgi:hypothetical protein